MNIDQAIGKAADGPITKFRFVKNSPTIDDAVTAITTAGEAAYGVSLFSVSAAEIALGKGVSVILDGRMILESSEAIPQGSFVGCESDGRARVADSGDYILGICDEASAGAGDQCSVNLNMAGAKAP